MFHRKIHVSFTVTVLLLTLSACSALSPQTGPTQSVEPLFTPSQDELPRTEAEVPRVTVEEAKAALDSGAAIVVDVRSEGAYEASHIPGAIPIPLGEFETNPAGLGLDKEQWILTYCT
ncbi:MAG TPA: rhodanese-like domain-containing protein [Anaerolineales bacterium]|nr:rhodanese-like domain-containing protein [Anaerolineales bacterium]